jgi:hypothetical protein
MRPWLNTPPKPMKLAMPVVAALALSGCAVISLADRALISEVKTPCTDYGGTEFQWVQCLEAERRPDGRVEKP